MQNIVFQNVVFKFKGKNQNKYQTNFTFRVFDVDSIERLKNNNLKCNDYIETQQQNGKQYEFFNPVFEDRRGKTHVIVKDKWLSQKDFDEEIHYQGDLELRFYSMEKPDLSEKSFIISPKNIHEGFFAKLKNIKPFQQQTDE